MEHENYKRSSLIKICCFCFLLLQVGFSYAQSLIKGVVRDRQDEPLIGATVSLVEGGASTMTDAQGRFTLSATKLPATVRVRYVGYVTKELRVSSTDNVVIRLDNDVSALQEVMVVAYGTQKKSTMVGSVAQINGDEIKRAPAMNVTNALAGRLPGLTSLQQSGRPGADGAALYVRGIGTYGGNRGPLVIVDDIERSASTLSYLDPNEIASITVLKDAVATAAYGVQAANGIILVKTKSGNISDKTKVSYDFSYSIGQNTRMPEFLNGPDYMAWYNKGTELDNEFLAAYGRPVVPYVYSQEMIDAVRNGTNTNPLLGNTDWVGLTTGKNSKSQHHSITLSGGSNKTKYFTGVNHMNQDGIVNNTNFKRYNVRSNVDSRLNDYLSVGFNLGLRHQITNTPGIAPDDGAFGNPIWQATRMLPNTPMYAPNGLPTSLLSNGTLNPIETMNNTGYQNYKQNSFEGQAFVNFYVPKIEGLVAKVQAAYDFSDQQSKTFLKPYESMRKSLDQVSGDYVHDNTPLGITVNTLRQGYSASVRKTLQGSLSYSRVFNNDHSVGGLVLYEYSNTNGNNFSAGASNFDIDLIQEINYGSKDPKFFVSPTGASNAETARAGVVSRFNYAFKGTYLLEVVNRWDASANFAKNNRWKSFPALGLGWVVSKEEFFDDTFPKIDYFKVKGSLGKSGNDRAQVGTFPYLATFLQNTSPVVVIDGKPVAAVYTSNIPNPDLKWEESTSYNIGFESKFFNNKLGLDFEWFYRLTTGILGSVSNLYPLSIGGYYPALANIGEVDNRGFDAQIKYDNQFGDFRLGLTGNVNWARNRILKMDEPSGTRSYNSVIGKSIGTKIGFVSDGFIDSWEEAKTLEGIYGKNVAPGYFRIRDLNGDGRIDAGLLDDMTYIGRSNVPELMFGLNIDMAYKGFDFSALLQGAALADVSLGGLWEGSLGTSGFDADNLYTRAFYAGGNSPYFIIENAWTPDNPNAEFPRLSAGKDGSVAATDNAFRNSGWIRKGDYLRLKAVQLGYTLPKSVMSKAHVDNLRLFVTGSNLFTLDHVKYLDPEMPNVNNGFYPQQRIYSFGVNVTF